MVLEAADPGASRGGVARGAEGQGGTDEPGDPNGPERHQGLTGMGEAGAASSGAPELALVPHTPGPGEDTLSGLDGQAVPWPGGQAMPGPGGHTVP